jgi:polyribonucleotide nucleotidyltransferase
MDFKVAGTADVVTALQLDTKIDGLPADVLAEALQQAKEARLQILEVMQSAIAEPRSDVRSTAPKIISFEIPMDKIGEVIGPKGKVINAITLETGADVSVGDDGVVGTVTIGSKDGSQVEEAKRRIELILDPPTAELGAEYQGRVVNITKFGAFVNILPGRDGLLHISKLGGGRRIDRVEDVLALGDEVAVRVDDIDNGGKLSLSLIGEDGDDVAPRPPAADRAPRDGGDRDDRDDRDDRGGREDRDDRGGREDRDDREERSPRPARAERDSGGDGRETASFEEFWDEQARNEFGDLGPAEAGARRGGGGGRGGRSGGRGGGRGGGDRGGRGGGRSRPRR